jgi:hypothetical protein
MNLRVRPTLRLLLDLPSEAIDVAKDAIDWARERVPTETGREVRVLVRSIISALAVDYRWHTWRRLRHKHASGESESRVVVEAEGRLVSMSQIIGSAEADLVQRFGWIPDED